MTPRETEQNAPPATFSLELQGLMGLVGRALGLTAEMHLIPASVDWDRLLKLADEHRVVPLLYSGLKAAPEITVPAAALARLAHQAAGSWRRSLIFSQELACLSQLFSSHQIAMAGMKGPGLSVQAYGSSAARAMRDLDILIHPEDFRRAQLVLENNGFVCESSISTLPRRYQDIYLRSATHISFHHAALGYCLEVHLRPMQVPSLLPIPTETLLTAACPVLIGGTAVPVLAPHHHFLYVAAHGAKHAWWRLLWLADFAAFQRMLQNQHSAGEASGDPETSSEMGLERVLGAAATLCYLSFGSACPSSASDSLSAGAGAIAARGRCCLERGRQPMSYAEKWDELFNLLQLRTEASYRLEVAKLYWDLTPADLDTLSHFAPAGMGNFLPPAVEINLIPVLRPALWAARRLPSYFLRGRQRTKE